MKKFSFRLQKVLDFREAMESLAKDAYLDSRAKRFEAEAVIIMPARDPKTGKFIKKSKGKGGEKKAA